MPNGVRVVRMNLFRDIPSIITIQNEDTMVVYTNQPKLCSRCHQPTHPGQKCSSTNSAEIPPASSSATLSADGFFKPSDFPSINDQQNKTSDPVPNAPATVPTTEEGKQYDDDWTDVDDNASSSSADYNVVTHKRRRSKKAKEIETKKACNDDQCSPTTVHAAERVLDYPSSKRVFSRSNKNNNFYNYVSYD